jgi:DNA polymerase
MEAELKSVLDWWESQGVEVPEIKVSRKPRPVQTETVPVAKAKSAPVNPAKAPAPQVDSEALAATAKTLAELNQVLDKFDAGALTAGARQAVFARGNPEARIMVIGEAPGREEDLHGKPFIGRAGQLLDRMLAAIGLDEEAVYITNVVNWRPEKNRTPSAAEIKLCRPFLMRHIELAKPEFLVLTGNVPLQALTGETGIMRQRGHWRDVEVGDARLPALPIYHPAFLLRQPALKKDAWRDLLSLRARLDDSP